MARREIASCVYNSQDHATLLLLAAFMQAYFSFIDLQLLIVAYALQNIRRCKMVHRLFRFLSLVEQSCDFLPCLAAVLAFQFPYVLSP